MSFDPTSNDAAGDAPLDLDSLRVVEASFDVSLSVTGSGELTWVPGSSPQGSAMYEICDINTVCTTANIDLYALR